MTSVGYIITVAGGDNGSILGVTINMCMYYNYRQSMAVSNTVERGCE